jgi:predicted neutral ceramidase superfamily lipid hydrolase
VTSREDIEDLNIETARLRVVVDKLEEINAAQRLAKVESRVTAHEMVAAAMTAIAGILVGVWAALKG